VAGSTFKIGADENMKLDILLEEVEKQSVQYFCMTSENHRYDIAVIHSGKFFGKAMVVSIQNGIMVLLCHEDIENDSYWAEKLGIEREDITDFQNFFQMTLNKFQSAEQY
jgi:hypothetical protein